MWISLILLDFNNELNILNIGGITNPKRVLKAAIGLDNLVFSKNKTC